jgi:hypothetical protein
MKMVRSESEQARSFNVLNLRRLSIPLAAATAWPSGKVLL